ncbi:MAG: hypothetical protein JO028_11025 [Acidobacteriaceae bacterium]|nr:hypothetical protein [Acidobacteriaceae bacterium]
MGWIDQRTGRTGGRPPRVVAALLPEPLHHCAWGDILEPESGTQVLAQYGDQF